MKLDHIGVAVNDLAAANALIERLLGRAPYKQENVADQGVTTSFFTAGDAAAKLELVAPDRPDNPLAKFLAGRGPGLHHLAFEVDDIRAEMKRLAADGFELLQTEPTPGADNKLVCFLHPKTTNGVLVEICQTRKIDAAAPPKSALGANYWADRYRAGKTGWDLGRVSPPIKEYLDGLSDKSLCILIPGAGNGYEAAYAWEQGFENVFVIDLAAEPLNNLRERAPDFPAKHLYRGDFFQHEGRYDLILEQTFFCALNPALRPAYAKKMAELLVPGGRLVGLWFDRDFPAGPPFGGSREEYLGYLEPYLKPIVFETARNSVKPRAGSELFGIFQRP